MGVDSAGVQGATWSSLVRSIAVSGVTGAVAGVLVGGIGGRLVMRAGALVDDSAQGAITDNGNRVGEITLVGTIELFVVALVFGVLGSVVWIASEPWLSRSGRFLGLGFGLLLFAIAGTETIVADNRDFEILDPAWFNVLLFALLFFAYGALFPVVRRLCNRALPGRRKAGALLTALYGLVLLLGLPFAILTFVALLSAGGCEGTCGPNPWLAGIAFTAMSAATVMVWWKQLHQTATHEVWLTRLGMYSLAASVVLGLVVTIPEVVRTIA